MGGASDVEINRPNSLIHSVLMLEQLLTRGGGWQDNIGGIVGGLKLGSSNAHVFSITDKGAAFQLAAAIDRGIESTARTRIQRAATTCDEYSSASSTKMDNQER